MEQKTLIQFPCTFAVKVIGPNSKTFSAVAFNIFHRHLAPDQVSYSSRLSGGDKYLSLTATITAHSQEQLDDLYRELNAHELVLMTL